MDLGDTIPKKYESVQIETVESPGGPISEFKVKKSFIIKHESIPEDIRKKYPMAHSEYCFYAHEKINGIYIEYLIEEDQFTIKDLRKIFQKKKMYEL